MRIKLIITLLVIIPLGIYTKLYHGPADEWVHSFAGDIFYPLFWFLLVLLIRPQAAPERIALWVFMACTLVEFSQLYHPDWLTVIRSTFPGQVLLGTHFVAWDILYYFLGCTLGLFLYKTLDRSKE
jgi:hypothetical protein